jgi:hypothetical protein
MGGGGSEQKTEIDPEFKPFMRFGLEEAKRLYGTMPKVPETLAVSPSAATLQAMSAAEQRALAGSPLTRQAQSVIGQQMGYTNPYAGRIEAMGMGAFDPSAGFYRSVMDGAPSQAEGFYRSMMAGQPESEAARLTKSTAGGAYLSGASPYLQGALSQANRLAGESFGESMKDLQAKAAAAGRYGSGAMAQQTAKSQDVLARALAEQNQKAFLENYQAERLAQETAMGRLGEMEQQAIANRFSGAGGLTKAEQQLMENRLAGATGLSAGEQAAMKTRLGALSAASDITAADLARQREVAGMVPTLAAQDYSDIQKLLQVGQGREAYEQQAIEGRLKAQDIPLDRLRRTTNIFYGAPLETKTATSGGK